MREYRVRREYRKKLEGDGLREIASKFFGDVGQDGDMLIASYGAIRSMRMRFNGKSLFIDTEMDKNVDDNLAIETIKKYNQFLYEATGYTAKERKKHLSKM
ncbi:MAG: hypothetical protein DRN20_03760 [Thermoplasmata archaeon]|nr:MAG: hypothetical protein DRN20_03760 [Thermoplasmata archaeon]